MSLPKKTRRPLSRPATPSFTSRAFARTLRSGRLLCVGALLAFHPADVPATTYSIATFADDAVVNGNCTLREALRAVKFNSPIDACPAGDSSDAIILPSGTYPFNGEEHLFGSGSLTVLSATLNPFDVTIDLQNAGRFVFINSGGPYVFAGLEIANGSESYGGAVSTVDVDLTIVNFRFVSNLGSTGGGAVAFQSGSSTPHNLFMHNGAFLSNQAGPAVPGSTASGGALDVGLLNGSLADLRDVFFDSNSITAGFAFGGALSGQAAGAGSRFLCARCNFYGNSVASLDAGAHGYGGAIKFNTVNSGNLTVRDSRFVANSASAGAGGGARNVLTASATAGATIELERLFIDANLGPTDSSSLDVHLTANSGASVWLLNSELTFGNGGGLLGAVHEATLNLGHLTIADYLGTGANIFGSHQGTATLQNSIVSFNSTADLVDVGGALLQTGNFIGGNPLFLNEPLGDYRLSPASPAINTGTGGVSTLRLADLDHGSRVSGGAPDKGCFEFNALFADGFDVGDTRSWSGYTP